MLLPDDALQRSQAAYRGRLLHEEEESRLHREVDQTKAELLHFEKGRQKSLSAAAIGVLARFAISEGIEPRDPVIRASAEAILAHWKADCGIDVRLRAPPVETSKLIADRHEGRLIGGWLSMCARDAGRPELLGPHQLSSRALLAAIEALVPYCEHRPYARGEERWVESEPSPAAKFFHMAIASFEPRVAIQNINHVLKTHGASLREQHKAIFAPRRR